jgi:hypothetical protein
MKTPPETPQLPEIFAEPFGHLTALTPGLDETGQLVDRVKRLGPALDAWPQLQKAIKALRALDVLAVHEAGRTVPDLVNDLGITRGRVYSLIKAAREDRDIETKAQLPAPFDTLLAPLLEDAGTLERAQRLGRILADGVLNDGSRYLAWTRSHDVLTLHRSHGIKYETLAPLIGLTSDRTAHLADMAKGTYSRKLPAERRERDPNAPQRNKPGESAQAVEDAMRALESPFSMAEVTEASGFKPGQVQRVLKTLRAQGKLRDAGPLPKGVGGRNVATFELIG